MNKSMHPLTTVILTGAGSSGKSSLLEILSHRYSDRIIVIPETVQILSESSLPFPLEQTRKEQYLESYVKLIVQIQDALEHFIQEAYGDSGKILLCDRSVLDTIPYVTNPQQWETLMDLSIKQLYKRYDYIFHLGIYEKGYMNRKEIRPYSLEQAHIHERDIQEIYKNHPAYTFVSPTDPIESKANYIATCLGLEVSVG